jgi:hypothetical protein
METPLNHDQLQGRAERSFLVHRLPMEREQTVEAAPDQPVGRDLATGGQLFGEKWIKGRPAGGCFYPSILLGSV